MWRNVGGEGQGGEWTVPPPGTRAKRRRWPYVLGGFVVLVIVAVIVAAQITIPYYVITPGDATPVGQYIEVPQADNHSISGNILLTDVFVSQLNALGYLQYRFLDSNNEIYSSADLLGPTTSNSEFVDQGYLEMAQAQSFATAAALSHLGYTVTSSNVGALIFGIVPGSPAAKALKVAQVITAVNGTPTTSQCGLIEALHNYAPGTTVTLSVQQSSINDVGSFVGGPVVDKTVQLAKAPKASVVTFCGGPPITQTAFVGVDAETQQDWQFPVKVTVHTQDIGGPSAGLAMTLGIIDKLSGGQLTGGRIVAATGTIDQNGNVGDVGGVAEKTIAVERAGATVFFVPKVELKTAEAKASSQLHVYAVSNLDQVLRILQRLGGKVTTNPMPAQAAS
ncbi:MAG TPA: S16 family serine protease [Acidimicrobiales bacterium]|nr:S16 family serine protease [Acidimicrobiales bacterium]